jgi:peptidylprolyl isomerase
MGWAGSLLLSCVLALTSLSACSGETGEGAASSSEQAPLLKEVRGSPIPPPIEPPTGPPPKNVVIQDLKRGRGAMLRFAQEFSLSYIAVDYKTGKRLETSWGRGAFTWTWGIAQMVEALEIGIKGMRVGGLRELLVPSRFAYDSGPRIYLVELLKVY